MYVITVRKEYITEGYFTTCKSHRDAILKQELVFAKLYTEEGFAVLSFSPLSPLFPPSLSRDLSYYLFPLYNFVLTYY
jgi:hypothetical protein